jgi:hypothetical protein
MLMLWNDGKTAEEIRAELRKAAPSRPGWKILSEGRTVWQAIDRHARKYDLPMRRRESTGRPNESSGVSADRRL